MKIFIYKNQIFKCVDEVEERVLLQGVDENFWVRKDHGNLKAVTFDDVKSWYSYWHDSYRWFYKYFNIDKVW